MKNPLAVLKGRSFLDTIGLLALLLLFGLNAFHSVSTRTMSFTVNSLPSSSPVCGSGPLSPAQIGRAV